MKFKNKITRIATALALPVCLLTSCNYLDVIPPEQADFDDTMKDESATLNFLYTCYGYVPRSNPYDHKQFEQSADEIAQPKPFNNYAQQMAWGTLSPAYYNSWGGDDVNIWTPSYNWLGYVHRFEDLLDKLSPSGVTEDDKNQYRAEAKFLDAYYHFRVLQAFGPCPIIDKLVDPNITNGQIPGRSHFDYCVNYIVGLLDESAKVLPATRTTDELGRATSVIAKCLKARVLLYAASPLWNGSFFNKNWKNKNYETEGYGQELVSKEYDPQKWQRALTACEEAMTAAQSAGYELFDIAAANKMADRDQLGLPFVPGKEANNDANNLFKERVRMFQYMAHSTEADNKELIWATRIESEYTNGGEAMDCRLPNRVIKKSDGSWTGGWASVGPTLYSVQHFYTENGLLPENDPKFPTKDEWYSRFYEGKTSPALETNGLDKEDVKNDIIKLNGNREARFYAWIVFDGDQYAQKITNGNPLWVNFKNSNTNGYRVTDSRNCVGTGYISRKFIDPNIKYTSSGSRTASACRRPLIRMAELYLNLAECYAAVGNTAKALDNLNKIRERAGLPDVTEADCNSKMSLTDWIRNERFVELYEEGHRYYDLRRWCIAPKMLKAGTRYGLNGLTINPSFEEFNQPTMIDQPFKWNDRSYLLPIWTRTGMDELYSNPQVVQAPGY